MTLKRSIKKVQLFHIADNVLNYSVCRKGLIVCFEILELKGAYRVTDRILYQAGAEFVAAYATRMTFLCSRACSNLKIKN